MSKHTEKLIILREHCQALLQRVYSIKVTTDNPKRKPQCLVQTTKLAQALIKTFPDLPPGIDKVPGYDFVVRNVNEIIQTLEDWYTTFKDVIDFKTAAAQELEDVAQNITDYRFDESLASMNDFFELLVGYSQLMLLLARVQDKRAIISLYNLAYSKVHNTFENNLSRITKLFTEVDDPNPYKKLQDTFTKIAPLVGKTLINLVPSYDKRSYQWLTSQRPLELLSEPDRIPYPSIQQHYQELMFSERLQMWIIFGYLVCPEGLGAKADKPIRVGGKVEVTRGLDLLAIALEEVYIVPLYGDESFFVHEPFEELFSRFKHTLINLKKEKRVLQVAKDNLVQNVQQARADRRIYLRLQLRSLLLLLTDSPGLIGPKFPLILAGLALAKEEVMWYFRHMDTPPKFANKKFQEIKDSSISHFFYLVHEICNLCFKHKNVISTYYKEFVKRCYLQPLKTMYAQTGNGLEPQVKAAMDQIMEDLSNGTNYFTIRLNFRRVQHHLTSFRYKQVYAQMKDLFAKLGLVVSITRHIDEIEQQIDEYCSLKGLYYFKSAVHNVFKASIGAVKNQALHSLSFIHLLNTYPDNAHPFLPEERQRIGQECVRYADQYFTGITNYIEKGLENYRGQDGLQMLDDQLGGQQAVEILKAKAQPANRTIAPPPAPGSESAHGEAQKIKNMYDIEKNLSQLMFCMNSMEAITVFDTEFYPAEYLRFKLEAFIRKYVKNITWVNDDHPDKKLSNKNVIAIRFPPPSFMWRSLRVFLTEIKVVEQWVAINCEELALKAFLEDFTHHAYPKSPFDFSTIFDENDNSLVIVQIAKFYTEVVNSVTKAKLLYSPLRRTFVTTPQSFLTYPIECYLDLPELMDLCRLVGPLGVRVIDQFLLDSIFSKVTDVKNTIARYANELKDFENTIYREDILSDLSRKFKGFEVLFQQSLAVGCVLQFRKNLHEALRCVMREHAPLIFNTVQNAHEQYPTNIFRDPKYFDIDGMVNDCGMPMLADDHAFKKVMESHADANTWELLPTAFAVLLTTTAFRDDNYDVNLEGWNNNAHVLVPTMISLIVTMQTIKTQNASEALIEGSFAKFVEMASMILLHMKDSKEYAKQIKDAYIFVDKVVQECSYVKQSTLEAMCPYSLFRSVYVSTYEPTQRQQLAAQPVDREEQ
eukprot:GEZU01003300.1.p1 GENE.GEZU01003300.1~~GEZU01003300.1.p1  ORF type:complete len:1155 (-),score=459.14 GEZU01003300.1:483-3947(-)